MAFVGIDSLNIDDTAGGTRPVHTALLGADIPIGEHFTTFPVRAYALLPALVLALVTISGCTTVGAHADAGPGDGGDGPAAEAATDGPPASGHRSCVSDAECSAPEATCQALANTPDGVCTHACSSDGDCAAGDHCVVNPAVGLGSGACVQACGGPACTGGLVCASWQYDPAGVMACYPASWLQ